MKWQEIENLKQFKLSALKDLLEQGAQEGIIKKEVHFGVLSAMLERISDMFTDYDFLIENGLKASQAMEEALNSILKVIKLQFSAWIFFNLMIARL